jgi:hypothetical protein
MKTFQTSKLVRCLLGAAGVALLGVHGPAFAKEDQKHPYTGNCASLGADRTTEFHGNPERADLLLGMAGNQWVVFDQVMRDFNLSRGLDPTIPANQAGYTLRDLRAAGRGDYYIQLIPPGQIRDQIKSGCMLLGNVDPNTPERNFMPFSIQVEFDVFASTNYPLMRDLAASGFVSEAKPYIKNKLDLLVTQGNPHNIGVAGTNNSGLPFTVEDYYKIFDIVMDLLDPDIPVSQVDHINEGIHNAINAMYQRMDQYLRDNDPTKTETYNGDYSHALDVALAAVATPLPGSPADTRTGISTNFDLATNDACNYGNGTLRFCEFAVLNKANTHETRVHHVETPERVRSGESWTGPLWITEVTYAQNSGNPVPVEGVDIAAADPDEIVNRPVSYSIALLSTAKHKRLGNAFIDWIRSPDGQRVYTDGGFIGLSDAELAGGECYSIDRRTGEVVITPRENNSCRKSRRRH